MPKFFLLLFLILFLIIRLGGFFIRLLFGSLLNQQRQSYQARQHTYQRQPKGGNVHVDYVPHDKASANSTIKGGDYVDFEEVK